MPTENGMKSARLANAAWSVRSADYIGLQSRDEYNAAANHARDLILSSWHLLKEGYHAPSFFLAITAFEEIAKVRVGHARSWSNEVSDVKRGKDPLFRHSDKHKIAVDPILLIGTRLADTIGKSRVDSIFDGYADGSLSSLREQSLYFSRDSAKLKLPAIEISPRDTMEHILIAIEMFDDYFDFMTAELSVSCDRLNKVFDKIAAMYNV